MKVVEDGHVYLLDNLGAPGHQELRFCRRSSHYVQHENEHDGTNTQEVIRALIQRSEYLDSLIPCDETKDAIEYLRMALVCYEARALRRKQEEVNRKGAHSEARERYRDMVRFMDEIEHRSVGPDGHIEVATNHGAC